jgi:hypothetical protein
MTILSVTEVKSEALLWLPSLRTPKWVNCMFGGAGSSVRSGFAIKRSPSMSLSGWERIRTSSRQYQNR